MMRRVRALILLASVLLLSSGVLAGQATAPTSAISPSEGELLKWGVTQGGLTIVVIVLLLSELRRSAALMAALNQATSALATAAEAARNQALAFTQLAESVRLCEAVRQMLAKERET